MVYPLLADSIIQYAKAIALPLSEITIFYKQTNVFTKQFDTNGGATTKIENDRYTIVIKAEQESSDLTDFVKKQSELMSTTVGVEQKGKDLLLNLSRTLALYQRLDEILRRIMDMAMEVLPLSDSCSLYIYDAKEDILIPRVTRGFKWKHLQHIRFKPGESLTGFTFQSKRPQIFHHTDEVYQGMESMSKENWKHFEESTPIEGGERMKAQSAMCCPLMIQNDCIGVVSINSFRQTGHFTDEDLDLLKAICNQAAFAVHRGYLFTELENQADKLMKLNHDIQLKNQTLEQTQHNHNELMKIAIDQQGMDPIIAFLSERLNASVFMYDEFRQLVSSYEKDGVPFEAAIPPFLDTLTPDLLKPVHLDTYDVVVIPIITRREPRGFLAISNKELPLDHLEKMLIEEAQNIISIELLKQEAVYETKQRIQGEFLEDIQGKVDISVLIDQAKLLGLSDRENYLFFGLHIDQQQNEWSVKETKSLHHIVEKFIAHYYNSNIIFKRNNGLRGIIGFPPDTTEESVRSQMDTFIDQLDLYIRRHFEKRTFSYALGRLTSLEEIRTSYKDVWYCIEIFNRHKRPNQRMTYREVGVAKMMMNSSEEELYQFVIDQVKPLMDYTKQNKRELLDTLEHYLFNHQHLKEVADALHLHSNTLNYRLRRISDILSVDIRDAEVIFHLRMAWNIINLLGTKEEWLFRS
ncbi:helix-turn-helix domain-containing protein [Alkalihalobacillus sp. CinArs1]|uniref:helix-turn-helix domain-containing protein n=1 Tax=Alkalihalobacillus sp. CinArs1 TaxID=2995314 RepID=UPI0022DD7253|nr:GAF domain-containing protein [Alkalihalobacillus sp. CinArs1]